MLKKEFIFFLIFFIIAVLIVPHCYTTKDSAELITGSYILGNIHPPGSIFYVLVLKLWITCFFFLKASYAANLFSWFCFCISCFFIIKIVKNIYFKILIILIILQNTVVLEYASITETDWFSILLILSSIFCFNRKKELLSCYFYILSLAVNAVNIFYFPIWLYIFYKNRKALLVMIIIIISLIFIFYIPIRASKEIFINWDNPNNFTRVLNHIFVTDFKPVKNVYKANDISDRFLKLYNYYPLYLNKITISILILLLLYSFFKKKYNIYSFLIILSILPAFSSSIKIDVMYHYYLLSFIISVIFIIKIVDNYQFKYLKLILIFIIVILTFRTINLIKSKINYPYSISKDYADNILRKVNNGILIIGRDCRANYFYYEKIINKKEIELIDAGLIQYDWYKNKLYNSGYLTKIYNNTDKCLINIIINSKNNVFIEKDKNLFKIIADKAKLNDNFLLYSNLDEKINIFNNIKKYKLDNYNDIEGKNILISYKNIALDIINYAIKNKEYKKYEKVVDYLVNNDTDKIYSTIVKRYYFLYAGKNIRSRKIKEAIKKWQIILKLYGKDKYAEKNIKLFQRY